MFLRIYDTEHTFVSFIDSDIKDLCIESELEKGYKTMSFSISASKANGIMEEGYIQTEDYEYVIKEFNKENNDYYFVYADASIEELQKTPLRNFESLTQTAEHTIELAIGGTRWAVVDYTEGTKKRTVRMQNGTVYDIIDGCRSVFNIEIEFDTVHKIVKLYNKMGSDKGIFVTNEHDLSSFVLQSSTHNFYTRIYPYGKDDLTISEINNGVPYIDNNTYSNKILSLIWIDQRYTIAESLKEDAIAKLAELAVPKRSYSCKMATLNKGELQLGDTITFIDTIKKIREKQRVKTIKWYPLTPEKTEVIIANTLVSFTESQAKLNKAAQLIDDNTDDGGYLLNEYNEDSGDFPFNPTFGHVQADMITAINASFSDVQSTQQTTGTLNATVANIGEATINDADIDNLTVGTINLTNINAEEGYIKNLRFDTATGNSIQVDSIVNNGQYTGKLSADNFDAKSITSDKLQVEDGFIDNAMIADSAITTAKIQDASITAAKIVDIDANTITAGTINTNRLLITDEDGNSIVFAINSANETPQLSHTTIDGGSITKRSITADNIVADTITSREIATNTITAENIQGRTITGDKIAVNTIDSDSLKAGSVTADKIEAGAISLGAFSPETMEFLNGLNNSDKLYTDEELRKFRAELNQFLNFNVNTGVIIGSPNSTIVTQITNDRLSFKDSGNEVAYINNEKIYVNKAEVVNEIKMGKYVFRPRANGNLSIIWEE